MEFHLVRGSLIPKRKRLGPPSGRSQPLNCLSGPPAVERAVWVNLVNDRHGVLNRLDHLSHMERLAEEPVETGGQ